MGATVLMRPCVFPRSSHEAVSNLCVFLQAHIQKVESTDMVELAQRLVDSKNCLTFLIECVNFSPADIRLNNSVFQWYARMGEIFDEHRKIIKDKTEQYQEGLKVGVPDFTACSHALDRFGLSLLTQRSRRLCHAGAHCSFPRSGSRRVYTYRIFSNERFRG